MYQIDVQMVVRGSQGFPLLGCGELYCYLAFKPGLESWDLARLLGIEAENVPIK